MIKSWKETWLYHIVLPHDVSGINGKCLIYSMGCLASQNTRYWVRPSHCSSTPASIVIVTIWFRASLEAAAVTARLHVILYRTFISLPAPTEEGLTTQGWRRQIVLCRNRYIVIILPALVESPRCYEKETALHAILIIRCKGILV